MAELRRFTFAIVVLIGCNFPKLLLAVEDDASPLVPLSSYVQDNDITQDPVAAEYVALRCVGFFRAGATAMSSETDPKIAPIRKEAMTRAAHLLETVIAIDMERTGRSKEAAADAMNAAEAVIARAYAAQMKADKAKGGDIGQDPIFTGDSDVCRVLPRS